MLISRFQKCSVSVKLTVFKSFCLPMYDMALWKNFSATIFSKFRSCYNKCIKKFFGYAKYDSMSGILMKHSLPTADSVFLQC